MTITQLNDVKVVVTRCAANVRYKSRLGKGCRPYVTIGHAVQVDPEFEHYSQCLIRDIRASARLVKVQGLSQ